MVTGHNETSPARMSSLECPGTRAGAVSQIQCAWAANLILVHLAQWHGVGVL